MGTYGQAFEKEKAYLQKVIDFLGEELHKYSGNITKQKQALVAIRKEMWLEGSRNTDDLERAAELNQYVTLEAIETSKYKSKRAACMVYEKMQTKPYFGRFDFTEEGETKEKIYIGYNNVMDDATYDVLVYDWRAPIASIFYRSELGKASYSAPAGVISGEVSLKRQYEIDKGHLKYFFDCSVTITDELLHRALGKNASSHMKNIVESIQKEQDQIIRDRTNDLLIVQGVAGSGKTSIAMHRVAFLLYDRLEEGLTQNQIVIISPNQLFGEYISDVLPELGEKNVNHLTIEEIFESYFGRRVRLCPRTQQLEYVITCKEREKVREAITFKGSLTCLALMDRVVDHFEAKGIAFSDVYYDDTLLETKENLKKFFLNNTIGMPIGKRLKRIEKRLLDALEVKEKLKRKDVYKRVQADDQYAFEEEREVNRILNDYRQNTLQTIKSFTQINVLRLYGQLMQDDKLFLQLAEGIELPQNIYRIRQDTLQQLNKEWIPYEDGLLLLYLKCMIEGQNLYSHIKQVVVDEAQDYYPIHYKLLSCLFTGAQYTVLGDIGQTIEKQEDMSLYESITALLKPKHALTLTLNKSYRSTYEISQFANQLRGIDNGAIAFSRHEEAPQVVAFSNEGLLYDEVVKRVVQHQTSGYESIALLCKTEKEAQLAYQCLHEKIEVRQVTAHDTLLEKGVVIMPIYMAKGLEFDAVIVLHATAKRYRDAFDRQLLYIAATRALHRLSFYGVGKLTAFLDFTCRPLTARETDDID